MSIPPRNPFLFVQSIIEHLQSAQIESLTREDVAYHLEAALGAAGRLRLNLARLLPGMLAAYEGEPTDTILDQIEGTNDQP